MPDAPPDSTTTRAVLDALCDVAEPRVVEAAGLEWQVHPLSPARAASAGVLLGAGLELVRLEQQNEQPERPPENAGQLVDAMSKVLIECVRAVRAPGGRWETLHLVERAEESSRAHKRVWLGSLPSAATVPLTTAVLTHWLQAREVLRPFRRATPADQPGPGGDEVRDDPR